jgi:hypothetical protein
MAEDYRDHLPCPGNGADRAERLTEVLLETLYELDRIAKPEDFDCEIQGCLDPIRDKIRKFLSDESIPHQKDPYS